MSNDTVISRIGRIFYILMSISVIVSTLTSTFFTIFVAEILGNGDYIIGILYIATPLMVKSISNTISEIPSGMLGDKIGYKYSIFISCILYFISFRYISMLDIGSGIIELCFIYMIIGIAESLTSYSLKSWFDNKYTNHSQDMTKYMLIVGRTRTLMLIGTAVSIIMPGFALLIVSRRLIFEIQSYLYIGLGVLCLILMDTDKERETVPVNIKESISLLVKNRLVLKLIIARALIAASAIVYAEMILYPMYYMYLINDTNVSIFRTIAFCIAPIISESSRKYASRGHGYKKMSFLYLFSVGGILFLSFFETILLLFQPLSTTTVISFLIFEVPYTSIIPIIMLLVGVLMFTFVNGTSDLLFSSVVAQKTHNSIRNFTYSFSSMLQGLLAVPCILITVYIMNIVGFINSIVFIGMFSAIGSLIIYSISRTEKDIKVEIIDDFVDTYSKKIDEIIVSALNLVGMIIKGQETITKRLDRVDEIIESLKNV